MNLAIVNGRISPVPTEASEKAFTLTYYTDNGPREIKVFMVRHSPDYRIVNDTESFTLHALDTGDWLGYGDSKHDAETAASIALHQRDDFGIPIGAY